MYKIIGDMQLFSPFDFFIQIKSVKFLIVICWLFMTGCASTNDTQIINLSNDIEKRHLSEGDSECFTERTCLFEYDYTNALGQRCKVYHSNANEKIIFCETNEKHWTKIKVL